MSDVRDLSEYRARRADRFPTREPDFTVAAWLRDGEVDWSHYWCAEHEALHSHRARTLALIDVAWQYGAGPSSEPPERPAVWWMLDNSGHSTLVYPRSLVTGSNWRHALWLVRQWWRLTRRLARLAWRMARGK